jgi:hypothetical protein
MFYYYFHYYSTYLYSYALMRQSLIILAGLSLTLFIGCQTQSDTTEDLSSIPGSHQELQDFFLDWRAFYAPSEINGIPDYSAQAMKQQYTDLSKWQDRLAAVDTTNWPIAHQVDWYIIWAEMNGLDFAHRVKQPWSRDPAFYLWFFSYATDVPEREGPNAWGGVEYDYYDKPLSPQDAEEIIMQLAKGPELLQQAKENLTGKAKDLWVLSEGSFRNQSNDLQHFAERMISIYPNLAKEALELKKASDEFADWLASQSSTKTEVSGVGKDNYSWNLKKVHLLPYTWEEEKTLMERELWRAHASLRLEENQNRALPGWEKISNEADYDLLVNEAIDDFMLFLAEEEIMTIEDNMDPAMRERADEFSVADGLRGFFEEVIYRDPMTMRAHHNHWLDLARMRDKPHESIIRSTPSRYNLFDGRAEGMATGMEEMLMHAGLYEGRPRGKELVWVMLAQRAARGLGGLYQHGQEMTHQEACNYASKWTPWGLLPADGGTIQGEEHFYLEQPAYGTSYVIGKIEIERLLATYAQMHEGDFKLKDFIDEFNRKGVIPVSLIYWEMTGDKSLLEAAIRD